MIKKIIIIFVVILVGGIATLGSVLLLSPQLLNLAVVQDQAKTITKKSFPGSAVTFDKLSLKWLPLPHLTVKNVAITHADARLVLPDVRLYPNWLRLVTKKTFSGKISVVAPRLTVHNPVSWLTSFAAIPPPGSTIHINNGSIHMEKPADPGLNQVKWPVSFEHLNAKFLTSSRHFTFNIDTRANFADKIILKGSYGLATAEYSIETQAKKIDISKLITPLFEKKLAPSTKKINAALSVHGKGTGRWDMDLKGDLPEFFLKGNQSAPLLGGSFSTKIHRNGSVYKSNIAAINIAHQKAFLSGIVERVPQTDTDNPGKDPIWSLNIHGKDLDLTAIRAAVLDLWPGNKAADTTCRIVKAGKAKTASYAFKGTVQEFKKLSAMTITADVAEASIHVPRAKLDLTDAWGPIRIENGSLSGQNLRASLGKSSGKNGTLFLDIDRDTDRFSLDLELDVDLVDLQPILQRLVPHKGFTHEVSLFSNVSGRAQGKLMMGDTLHDFDTTVLVTETNGSFFYQRLPWPVTLQNASLLLSGKKIQWQRVKGSIGAHRIENAEGSVTWANEPYLTVHKLSGSLDLRPFLDTLKQYAAVQERLPSFVHGLSGRMDIQSASLTGPFFQPSTWKFSLSAGCDTLNFTLADTAQNATLTDISTRLSDDSFYFSSRLWLLSQSLDMEGDLSHHHFSKWKGWTTFNGMLQKPLLSWLTGMVHLPETFSPKTPSVLEDMRLTFHNGLQGIHGTIKASPDKKNPAALLDLVFGDTFIVSGQMKIMGHEKTARIGMEQKSKKGKKTFLFSFDGTMDADDVDELIKASPLLSGTLSGSATVEADRDDFGHIFMSGAIKGENLRWSAGGKLFPLTLQRLHVTGSGENLNIHKALFLKDDENVALTGSIGFKSQILSLDLGATSEMFRWSTLDRLIEKKNKGKKFTFLGRDLQGSIRFDIKQVNQGPHLFNTHTDKKDLSRTIFQVHGAIEKKPELPTRVHIENATKCGVHFKGDLFPFSDTTGDSLVIFTNTAAPPTFQEFIACLGATNDLIDGTFTLTGTLYGKPENWQKGSLKLFSPKGRINRLTFFSKVLSVINLTDILSAAGSGAGLSYEPLEITANVKKNKLFIEKGVINGDGLKIYAKGDVELSGPTVDLTLLFAPLKTIDAVVRKIPLINKMFTGKHGTIFAIPVNVKGSIDEPDVTYLPASDVSMGLLNLIGDTLSLPFKIISPILPDAPAEKEEKTQK